jgi:hypothetical protein
MSKKYKELSPGFFIEHKSCIASELKAAGVFRWGEQDFEECGSSNGNAIYEHDTDDSVTYSGTCFSCDQSFKPEHISKSSLAEELGMDTSGVVGERKEFTRKDKQVPLSKDKVKELMAKFPYLTTAHRGIRPETLKFFGHLAEVGKDGKVKAFYYPETREGGWPVGYKIRYLPKYFSKIGQTGLKSDLAGQCKFTKSQNARDVLLVGGELDMASAFQILRDDQIRKNQSDYDPIPVVSPTTGEGSAAKQVAANYEFFDQFENIYVGLDNDDAGIAAMEAVVKVLPQSKVKVIAWSEKDPNAMLVGGKSKQFMSDFWRAKELVPSDIKHSANALEEAREFLNSPKIGLPPAFHRLQDNMRGGIKTTGAIINLIGDTSIGKCHGKGTKVWSYDGNLVNVEDVKVGDLLMGPDGTPRTVLNTTIGHGKLYKVKQERGISYIVNDKHVLSLRAGYDCKGSNVLKGDIVNIPVEEYKNNIGNKLRRSLKGYKADLGDLSGTSSYNQKLERVIIRDQCDTTNVIDTAISVEDAGDGEYFGFMLDSDHLYCLEDLTVTHNSLFTDALLYYWFWASPLVPTIVSLERTTGELTCDFLSMHLKNNLAWFEKGEDALAVLDDPDNKELVDDLLMKDTGESRYHVLDDRSGTPESLKACVERAVAQYGSRLIIFDPLTDFLRSLGTEAQESFMMWQKQKKKDGIVFINVLHTRKPSPDKDGNIREVTEYDALGSGTFVQSADANIVINRNKMAECPVERNTTHISVPKVRGGVTGHGGDIYYDYKERALHDLKDHMESHPEIEDSRVLADDDNTKGNFRVGKKSKGGKVALDEVMQDDGTKF